MRLPYLAGLFVVLVVGTWHVGAGDARSRGATALPWEELEYGVPYHLSLNQCQYKIFHFSVEKDPNGGTYEPDGQAGPGMDEDPYYQYRMPLSGMRLVPNYDPSFHISTVPSVFVAPPGRYFSTGVTEPDTPNAASANEADPSVGGAELFPSDISVSGEYELLLMARAPRFESFPTTCDVGPRPEAPTTFTFKLTHGCTVCGTPQADVLRAHRRNWDVIEGYGGNDRIVGGPWSDQLHGYRGNDVLIGGGRRDWLYGEDGNDVIYARDHVRDRVISCGAGFDTAYVDRKDRVNSDCERVVRR